MIRVMQEKRANFHQELRALIDKHYPADAAAVIDQFSRRYHRSRPIDELIKTDINDVYGATVACWTFLQEHDHEKPKVRIFNPDYEQHGWQSTHTIIEILHKDMPFLLDSVRLEVNRRELTIHAIQSAVFQIQRNSKHQLDILQPADHSGEDGSKAEAVIYLEVDRQSGSQAFSELQGALLEVLAEVRVAVGDFTVMKNIAENLDEELDQYASILPEHELDETKTFFQWLCSDHFSFLGYESFTISGKGAKQQLVRDESSVLGILKNKAGHKTKQLISELPVAVQDLWEEKTLLSFSKSATRSIVHRPAYPDYISLKRFDRDGQPIGEHRFVGLYTSSVYTQSPRLIPVIRNKASSIIERSGFDRRGHKGKDLAQIIQSFPRDYLFQCNEDELYQTTIGVFNIQERRQVRLFINTEPFGKFVSCLVYIPRERYNTETRNKIQDILCRELNAHDAEFNTFFSESVLARTHFILRVDPSESMEFDAKELEELVRSTIRSWDEDLVDALVESCGEEKGSSQAAYYRHAFPASYRDDFSPRMAVADVQHIGALTEAEPLGMSFYRVVEDNPNTLRFKLFSLDTWLALSDIIPVLENLGLKVNGECPYQVKRKDEKCAWIHDFRLEVASDQSIDLEKVKDNFQDCFANIWRGQVENDAFNKLVLGVGLSWREISMLRAYARYMKQIRFGISQAYIAETLQRHVAITKSLVDFFMLRFDPATAKDSLEPSESELKINEKITEALDAVENLNEDKIIRRYLDLIKATLRTNYFQRDSDGELKSYISLKFNPTEIPDIPLPRPMFEVFVYSPRVEGVHLRGGKVARGGLRWSDRMEDFRTEVLGLVKAQQVKNAVIVPVGAKGGFVAKQMPENPSREEMQKEGIACYQNFISGLLDITDNLIDGEVVPPKLVVRKDEDDPYLVVAADKGTATFSDIANGIAESYGFWLGDAFASGGSVGYDHKGMGITAKGAWVSVQRHFRELGVNVQEEDFTVVGIGDMAGDVFGNGMLLSEHICLVVAFNHMHIFVDPNPDSATSFQERKRLFELPRSSWSDYKQELISKGGGVFARSAKSIIISAEMKERFNIEESALAPNDLINRLLKAPVDLIWNGGIGTYVKAKSETHADVGDKANDCLRIDGHELNCRVIGEGGNLGTTQLSRVEYCLNNGAMNTDFIDNAAGVDCSDHEVNIKILLNDVVANGDMTIKQRNKLLAEMTDEVSELVLKNNYRQTQAISIAEYQGKSRVGEYARFMSQMAADGKLNRALEYLPDEEALAERKASGKLLTRPELSVLVSYNKGDLKEMFIDSNLPDDPYIQREVETAFPSKLAKKYKDNIYNHKLKREIVATQIANHLVNHLGLTFVHRLKEATGRSESDIAMAYVAARDVFELSAIWEEIEALDYQVDANVQMDMMAELMHLIRRGTRWFLRNRRCELNPSQLVKHFKGNIKNLSKTFSDLLSGVPQENWQQKYDHYVAAGVSEGLAARVAGASNLYAGLAIIEAADQTEKSLQRVTEVFFAVGEKMELDWFASRIVKLQVSSHWHALARESYRDDLDWQQRALTVGVLQLGAENQSAEEAIELWIEQHRVLVERWKTMVTELRSAGAGDFAMVSVAIRELLDLAQTSVHSVALPEVPSCAVS